MSLRLWVLVASAAYCIAGLAGVASATGTARVQQRDGDVKIYRNVRISIENKQMTLISGDRVGTIVIQKAACSAVDKLIRCYPYAAVLKQRGGTRQIFIENGTAWLNPSDSSQHLPMSSTKLPPQGVLMSVKTKAGTYFSLTGIADRLKR